MYHRVYALPLKSSTSAADVELLREVLTSAPQHVPNMCISEVFLQRSPLGVAPYELIWRSAFVDEAAHRAYGTNPYHCNVIDTSAPRAYLNSPAELSACSRLNMSK